MIIVPELDHPTGTGPKLYWQLVQALENLLNDNPQSGAMHDLRHEADGDGNTRPVPINQSNVAIESGNANRRKFISGERCQFPKLAAHISELRPTHGLSEQATERLKRQAKDLATLDQRVRVLRSRVLEAISAKQAVEQKLLEAEDQIVRLKRRAAA